MSPVLCFRRNPQPDLQFCRVEVVRFRADGSRLRERLRDRLRTKSLNPLTKVLSFGGPVFGDSSFSKSVIWICNLVSSAFDTFLRLDVFGALADDWVGCDILGDDFVLGVTGTVV